MYLVRYIDKCTRYSTRIATWNEYDIIQTFLSSKLFVQTPVRMTECYHGQWMKPKLTNQTFTRESNWNSTYTHSMYLIFGFSYLLLDHIQVREKCLHAYFSLFSFLLSQSGRRSYTCVCVCVRKFNTEQRWETKIFGECTMYRHLRFQPNENDLIVKIETKSYNRISVL